MQEFEIAPLTGKLIMYGDKLDAQISKKLEAVEGVDITDFAPCSLSGTEGELEFLTERAQSKAEVERLTKGEIEDIEILGNAVIREFLSRRHLFETLNKFNEEENLAIHDMSKSQISSRSELSKRFNLTEQAAAARKRGLCTFLDTLIYQALYANDGWSKSSSAPRTTFPQPQRKGALRKTKPRSASISSVESSRVQRSPIKTVSFDLSKIELIPQPANLQCPNDEP